MFTSLLALPHMNRVVLRVAPEWHPTRATLVSIHGVLFAMLELPPLRSQAAYKEAIFSPNFPNCDSTYEVLVHVCLFGF